MEISKGIRIKDLCLIIGKTLVIPDIHMGYEEALNKQGFMLPRAQFDATMKRLERIIGGLDIEAIVFIGDVKHEFGNISDTEWRHTLHMLDFLSEHCKKIILIRGNHDTKLGPIAKKRYLEIEDHYVIGDIYLCHGDEIPGGLDFVSAKRIIIGHEHPAVGLRKDMRVERFKCFLKGKFQNKELIVMPSFNLVTEGTDVIREDTLSPFLEQPLGNFNVYIIEDDGNVLDFGELKMLKDI